MLSAHLIFQALADATRWEIVRLLAGGPRCVCELTAALELPQSTLSTHLQVLRAAGVLVGERRGRWMYYGIARETQPMLRSLWKHFPIITPAPMAAGPLEDCRKPKKPSLSLNPPKAHDPI